MKYLQIQYNNQFNKRYLLLGTILCFLITNLIAQGDLLIFPKRVVFENDERIEIINLTNIGNDTATYHITFVQYRMTEKGDFILITEPDSGQFFASPFIRYYPRSVKLGPKESQVVKLQLIKTNILTHFEYRSHLYFRSETRNKNDVSNTHQDSTVSISLIPVVGITIPCIIHPVSPVTQISLSNLRLIRVKNNTHQIAFEFTRRGHFSSYGVITVTYNSPNGAIHKIAELKGVAVYSPGSTRECLLNILPKEEIDFNTGNIRITYTSSSPENRELASATLNLTQ